MASKNEKLLLLVGAGALLFLSGKKKKKSAAASGSADASGQDDLDAEDQIFETDDSQDIEDRPSGTDIIDRYTDPNGKAQLGMLYQVKYGDTPLEVAREALFGSRAPVFEAWMRQAAKDLIVRIDCGPWNQAAYGVPLDELRDDHANIGGQFTQRGVSFKPRYSDNRQRIIDGLSPTSAPGNKLPMLWIPMIDLDRLDMEGLVTTEGMNYPDTENGLGGNMIDPPEEIINLGFEQVSATEVGCDLPEGDYRRTVVSG